MLIELIGCTSTGKSTFTKQFVHDNQQVATGEAFVLSQVGMEWLPTRLLRLLVIDFVTIGMCLRCWKQFQPLLTLTQTHLKTIKTTRFRKLNTLRNVAKMLGMSAFTRRYAKDDKIILMDEGAIQIAHYLFVHHNQPPNYAIINRFAQLIPLPDAVWLMQDERDEIIERLLQRGHKRVPANNRQAATNFVQHALDVFNHLAQIPRIVGRLRVIESSVGIRYPVFGIQSA